MIIMKNMIGTHSTIGAEKELNNAMQRNGSGKCYL